MFKNPESVAVCRPTGSAAFSAGGTTCHHKFSLPLKSSLGEVGAASLKRIKEKLRYIVALIIDERSMISSGILAMMEQQARLGAYSGQRSDQPWGGIPIIIMVGDDFQLPSVDPGSIHLFDKSISKSDCTIAGEDIFIEFASNVMKLDGSKRQHEDQTRMMQLLEGLRAEEGQGSISLEDAKYLCSFCINNLENFSEQEASQLCDEDTTLFLFANRQPKENFNRLKLFKQHSQQNPVAIIKASTSQNGKTVSRSKHFDEEDTPMSTSICHNAKVQITGKNILPSKGLYNGSIGVVKDIVFASGHSPNSCLLYTSPSPRDLSTSRMPSSA